VHDVTEGINILGWLFDLEFDVLDFFSKLIHVGLSFLKEILSIGIFPEDDPLMETSLDVIGLQAQSTDLVMDHDGTNFVFTIGEIEEFLLEVLKLWVGTVEFGEFLINLLLPKPVELLEALKELVDVVFGSLD
jgi:hypothetical protein